MFLNEAMIAAVRRLNFSLRISAFIASFVPALLLAAPADAQSTARIVENRASVAWTDGNGNPALIEASAVVRVAGQDGGAVTLDKSVDRATAAEGDTVVYTIHWRNAGLLAVAPLVLTDSLPESISFIPNSVTSRAGVATRFTGRVLQVTVAEVAAGDSGSVSFAAIVGGGQAVTNVASGQFIAGPDTISVVSDTVVTRVQEHEADVRLKKSVDLQRAATGDTLSYVVRWRNTGAGSASSMTLTDTLPAGLSFVPGSMASRVALDMTVAGRVLTMRLPDIMGGDTGSVSFRAVVQQREPGVARNYARGAFTSAGTRRASVSDTTHTELLGASSALVLRKRVSSSVAASGDTLRYTVSWRNVGEGLASDVVITDTLPAGLAFVQGSVTSRLPVGVTAAGRVLNFTLPSVAAADSASLTFSAVVLMQDPGSASNTAYATYTSIEQQRRAVSDTTHTQLLGAAGAVVLRKRVDRPAATPGDTLRYTIGWRNVGNGRASALTVVDSLPAALHIVPGSITGAGVTPLVNGQVLRIDAAELAPGDSAQVSFAAVIAAQANGPLQNVVRGSFVTQGVRRDATPAAATVRVDGGAAAIEISKSVNRTIAAVGDTLTYTLQWRNSGAGRATGVVVTDTIPQALTLLPASVVVPATAFSRIEGRTLTIGVGTVAPGDSGSVTFAAVVAIAEGDITNGVRAGFVSEGATRVTPWDTVTTRVLAPEMKLELEALTDRAMHVGDTLVYRIRLINPSDVMLRDVALTDSIADELRFLSADPAPGRFSATGAAAVAAGRATLGGLVHWEFAGIAPGDTITIHLHTVVMSVGNGELVNVATADGAGLRQALAAVATVTTDERSGLSIRKSASALESATGEVVGYTLTLRNSGTSTLNDVVVTDVPGRGLHVQQGSVRGATMTLQGGIMQLHVGALAGGAEATVRYSATVEGTRGDIVRNRAWAQAAGGVITDTVDAAVRVRDAALVTRVVVGRVWLDDNRDGRQQPAEAPLAHAVIWTSQGETVRADSLGRFTFPDLAAGRYTFRVDPMSVPAGYNAVEPVSVRLDGWTTPSINFAVPAGTPVVLSRQDSVSAGFLVAGLAPRRLPRFAAPRDGTVFGTNRTFARIEGEPGAMVTLLDNDSIIGESRLRPDGTQDFVGLGFEPGAHVLTAVVKVGDAEERITTRIHVSGQPVSLVRTDSAELRAGAVQMIALRVLDQWRVPVAQVPLLTVQPVNLRVIDRDADPGSVGMQLPVAANGTLLVPVRADSAGSGSLLLSYGEMRAEIRLEALPEIRSLVLLGDGEVGIGASSRAYGAIIARGAIDERTALTMSYDSRRERNATFGGAYDPLNESRYPILGDASERTVLNSAITQFSMRLERDRSWLLMGDVDARGFGDRESLMQYTRALPGVSGRIESGPLTVHGFGSTVAQQLVQRQIRGNGTSGPYMIGGGVRLGTDRLVIEKRDRLNASIVLSTQPLERFVDYDIDATTGAVLLRRPLTAADEGGNPQMLVVFAEQVNGDASFVGGVRAEADATSLLPIRADSVRIGAAWIEDRSPLGGHTLMSGDVRASTSWGGGLLEMAHGAAADSAGTALRAAAWLGSRNGEGLRFDWHRVGDGFANPANTRLVSGTEDVRVTGKLALADSWKIGAAYQRQWFRSRGAERAQASVQLERMQAGMRTLLDVGFLDESARQDGTLATYQSLTGKVAHSWGRQSFWIDGTQPLNNEVTPRPRSLGAGMSYDVGRGIRLEASHRLIDGDSAAQGVSKVGINTEFSTGTRAWSHYELASGAAGHSSAALIGIGQKLNFDGGWTVDGHYERREGLSELPVTDPLRGMPFVQQESDRWSASAGVSWIPANRGVRASMRAELHDDAQSGSGYRVFGTGEAALSRALTLLLRQEAREDRMVFGDPALSSVAQSIAALAFRPADRSDWNALARLEWRRDVNPRRAAAAVLNGTDQRVIAALEAIWTPSQQMELGMRYAVRQSLRNGPMAAEGTIEGQTHFAGARFRRDVSSRIDLRANFRMLMERHSGLTRWDAAPAIGIELVRGLELETGYRFGDLRDADFASSGGRGFYATLGISFTEQTGRSIADMWRERIGGSR